MVNPITDDIELSEALMEIVRPLCRVRRKSGERKNVRT